MLKLGLKLTAVSALSLAAYFSYSPLSLFAAGEQGVWYDPSDFSTMFQDSAGTTPVTAVEQPVGLILDKSKLLAVGADALNGAGSFSSAGSWAIGTGWSIGSGVATAVNAASMNLPNTLTSGKWYKITLEVTSYTSGTLYAGTISNLKTMPTGTGIKTAYFLADATAFYLAGLNAFNGTVDNVVVTEIAGNHASQSTTTSRPVLSSRVNLLTYSEQFDNAAWTKGSGVSVSSNTTIAPDGTTTADTVTQGASADIQQSGIAAVTTTYTYSISVKRSDTDWLRIQLADNADTNGGSVWINTSTGSLGSTVNLGTGSVTATNVSSQSNTFYRVSLSVSVTSPTSLRAKINTATADASNTRVAGSFIVWGADLRPTNQTVGLPAYQRVGAATSGSSSSAGTGDYDTSGFPYYLKFDGTDDWLQTATINPGSVDKAQVFAGVRKLSDATGGVLAELSADINSNNGSLIISAPFSNATPNYGSRSKGTTAVTVTSASSYTAPITNILSALHDISGDSAGLRVNGTGATPGTSDQGTGNYLTYPLYIGRRGGTTLPFNGQLYGLLIRFSSTNLDNTSINNAETWMNSKTKAY